jgi:dCMP deaminase
MSTKAEVIHAERNAIDKMTRQGVPIEGSIMFTTLAPCLECAKSMHGLGFSHIYYRGDYRCSQGLEFLNAAGVPVTQHT